MSSDFSSTSGDPETRKLGVVGTMVWDTIYDRDGRTEPVEEWGGVSYALAALSVALPEGWEVFPIIKVGRDLAEEALTFLRELPRVEVGAGIQIVPDENNRVELRYHEAQRRSERLVGGVPPWNWAELSPLVKSCDAVYVNFITGFEMDLDTAKSLRAAYPGPTYADLHSLFLGIEHHGLRVPQALPFGGAWLRCFDAVQMNDDEFELLGRSWGDPWRLAAEVVGTEVKLITVTMGPAGAGYVAGPGFSPDPDLWPGVRHSIGAAGSTHSGRVAVQGGERGGDPTGCGDVWGATFFARLLAGEELDPAMEHANRLAARNVEHRGARGLTAHLKGQVSDRIS